MHWPLFIGLLKRRRGQETSKRQKDGVRVSALEQKFETVEEFEETEEEFEFEPEGNSYRTAEGNVSKVQNFKIKKTIPTLI